MHAASLVQKGRLVFCAVLVTLFVTYSRLPVQAQSASWENKIEQVMRMQGEHMPDGVLRFDLPRTDLKLTISGKFAQPNLAADGYAAFRQEGGGTFMTGELVLLEDEVNPVVKVLEHYNALGIDVTAKHNHLIFEHPRLIYIHFTGFGDTKSMAQIVVAALSKTRAPKTNDDNQQDKDDTISGVNQNKVEQILGGEAKVVDHVLEISTDCTNTAKYAGHDFPPAMGPQSELHFQSLGNGKAMVAAEICVQKDQVDPVEQELLKSGMFVESALHNHWTKESPRMFFVHSTGVGDAVKLAEVLKQALHKAGQ